MQSDHTRQAGRANPRNVRRRARVACAACRSRKVRCDVVNNWPCTNCRLDRADCQVPGARHRVHHRKSSDTTEIETTSLSAPPRVAKLFPSNCEDYVAIQPYQLQKTGPIGLIDYQDPFQGPVSNGHGGLIEQTTDSMDDIDVEDELDYSHTGPRDFWNNLPPDLDMSSALALVSKCNPGGPVTERETTDALVLDPWSTVSTRQAHALPPKELRDDLIVIYFKHVHPLCPVVDEVDFAQRCASRTDDEWAEHPQLLLLQAMLFAAFSHVSGTLLAKSPYTSVYEGQRVLFSRASTLYHYGGIKDEMLLTKTAILLTYWSPYDSESRVNHYWVAEAFRHARKIRLWDPDYDSKAMCCRRRLVWWCCLVRDRIVSLGLRRPYRLQETRSVTPPLRESDFGRELLLPRYSDRTEKRSMVTCFIWLCKLSDIIVTIANLHERSRFGREWHEGSEEIDPYTFDDDFHEAAVLESRLTQWQSGFQYLRGKVILDGAPGSSQLPTYVHVVADSLLAALYAPFLCHITVSAHLICKARKTALDRIKHASVSVAGHIRRLRSSATVEDVPCAILAWIVYPMLVHKILSEPAQQQVTVNDPFSTQYSLFASFMAPLEDRFHQAQVITHSVQNATDEVWIVSSSTCRWDAGSGTVSMPPEDVGMTISESCTVDRLGQAMRSIDGLLAQITI